MKTKNVNKGFTLIEVLLVITLIGILLTIGLVNFNADARFIDARNDIRKTHIQTLESTITQYKLQKGSYPAGLTRDYQEICDPDATSCTGFIDLKSSLVPDFIQAIPQDPNDTDNTSGSGYEIAVDEASNTVSIRLKEALREGGVEIKVNDPLPSLETSNANTPLAAAVPNPPPIVTNGLVLHLDAGNPVSYPGSGTTWTDLSGNNNNGTLVNGVGFNGDNGGSLSFDGVNDYSEKSSPNLGITGNASITMSCWFYNQRTSTSTFQALFAYGNGPSSGDTFAIGLNNLNISMQFNGGNATNSSNNIYSLNTWNNAVVTKTPGAANTTTKLYLNGVEQSIASSTTITPNVVSRVIRIGRWTNEGSPYYFQGRVSNCLIYNRALTPEEIQQNFNATRGRFGL